GSDSPSNNQTNPPSLYLSVLDLSGLPELSKLGDTAAITDPLGWGLNLQPVWPKPGLLVWSGAGGGVYPLVGDGAGPGAAFGQVGIVRPWLWGGNGGRLFAFDVSAPSAPSFVSEMDLTTNNWWSFSSAFTAGELVYLSHQSSEFVDGVILAGQTPPTPIIT